MAFIRSRGLRILFAAVAALTLVVGGGYFAFYLAFLHNLPDMRELADYDPPIPSRVFDREGQLIGEFFTERRRLTPQAEVPDHVVNAFVAGEDSRGTLLSLITKPIRRWEVLLGKFLAYIAFVAVVVATVYGPPQNREGGGWSPQEHRKI